MNMPLVLLNRRRRGTGFNPASLFGLNEPGVWYDPSDLSTLFQDTAGATHVTTPGQAVALMLDKSKGLTLGAELVTNGDFSNPVTTGWSATGGALSVVDGWLRLTTSAALAFTSYSFTTVIGASYRFSGAWRSSAGSWRLLVGTSAGGNQIYAATGGSSGSADVLFVATSTTTFVSVRSVTITSGDIAEIDNISVRELPGAHATQATAASRPTYGVVPLGGRRNLLTYSEEFENAVWSKVRTSIAVNVAIAPNGTMTADKAVEDTTAANNHIISRILGNPLASGTYTYTVYAKADGRRYLQLMLTVDPVTTNLRYAAMFDLQDGVIAQTLASSPGPTGAASAVTSVSDGWYRCSITVANPSGLRVDVQQALSELSSISPGPVAPNYTGNGTSGILIWGAQLELGSTATAYQRTTTAFDVTEAGVQSLSYLSFDGVDDFMVTPTITPGVDKAQVFAGVRKLSDAAAGAVAELSINYGLSDGSFILLAPEAATPSYRFGSSGSVRVINAAASGFAAPITNVLTGLGDISGDLATLRANGTQAAQSTADQGTGNYLAYPIYLGRRGGTSLPFNGHIYSLITRFGANLTTTAITNTETWVNSRTGAF